MVRLRTLLLFMVVFGLAACGEDNATPRVDAVATEVAAGVAATLAANPTATSTPVPPTPTIEPTPTHTPIPTVTPTPVPLACSTSSGERIFEIVQNYVDEWSDAFDLALSTPRIALSNQIANMQNIRQRLSREDWPPCAEYAQSELAAAKDATIDGFIAFLGQASDAVIAEHFAKAIGHLENVTNEIDNLRPATLIH